ncbi:helix-turn-helix domain-containing protein [Lawsonibacter sp. JLR.KK007]|uniref:helix-turn-helix domain-containing protein n=1 Tax=Lawsonibacter sp. JLR.KK007 TaxID=3114293 RepID=UPI002FF06DD0
MFYEQFLVLCQKNGTSPAAVARALGLGNSTTTVWKKGSIPKGDTLQKLADYFGVSVDYLLGISDSAWAKAEQQIRDTSSPSILGEPLPEDVQRVASSMEQMNEEGRGKVVDYAEDLEASGRYKKRGAAGMGKEA